MPGHPERVQSLILGYGSKKQTNATTASSTFNRFPKIDTGIPFILKNTENDAKEIGKGNEFVSRVFKTNSDFTYRAEKFGSAEFMLWAWGGALSNVALASTLYTIIPLDPTVGLEPLYTSLAVQLGTGGPPVDTIDELHLGLAIESVETTFTYSPGRESLKTTAEMVGLGRATIPSGIVIPATLVEDYMLSSSMAATILGVDLVAGSPGALTLLKGSMGWRNNFILPLRYQPGSGIGSDGFAVGARLLIGERVPTLSFTAFLQSDSTELAQLIAQTSGTAVITFTYDSTHTVTFDYPRVQLARVERTNEAGLVAVTVEVAPEFDPTNGVLQITGKCAVADLWQ